MLGPLERSTFGIEDDENADPDDAERHQAPECDIEDFRKGLRSVGEIEMAEPFHMRPGGHGVDNS